MRSISVHTLFHALLQTLWILPANTSQTFFKHLTMALCSGSPITLLTQYLAYTPTILLSDIRTLFPPSILSDVKVLELFKIDKIRSDFYLQLIKSLLETPRSSPLADSKNFFK